MSHFVTGNAQNFARPAGGMTGVSSSRSSPQSSGEKTGLQQDVSLGRSILRHIKAGGKTVLGTVGWATIGQALQTEDASGNKVRVKPRPLGEVIAGYWKDL